MEMGPREATQGELEGEYDERSDTDQVASAEQPLFEFVHYLAGSHLNGRLQRPFNITQALFTPECTRTCS